MSQFGLKGFTYLLLAFSKNEKRKMNVPVFFSRPMAHFRSQNFLIKAFWSDYFLGNLNIGESVYKDLP